MHIPANDLLQEPITRLLAIFWVELDELSHGSDVEVASDSNLSRGLDVVKTKERITQRLVTLPLEETMFAACVDDFRGRRETLRWDNLVSSGLSITSKVA